MVLAVVTSVKTVTDVVLAHIGRLAMSTNRKVPTITSSKCATTFFMHLKNSRDVQKVVKARPNTK
jgi:S-ribosylhomocysteine lyase LuxS involved in autoinducer biosynthesis